MDSPHPESKSLDSKVSSPARATVSKNDKTSLIEQYLIDVKSSDSIFSTTTSSASSDTPLNEYWPKDASCFLTSPSPEAQSSSPSIFTEEYNLANFQGAHQMRAAIQYTKHHDKKDSLLRSKIMNTAADASIHTSAIPVTNTTQSQFYSPQNRDTRTKNMNKFLNSRFDDITEPDYDKNMVTYLQRRLEEKNKMESALHVSSINMSPALPVPIDWSEVIKDLGREHILAAISGDISPIDLAIESFKIILDCGASFIYIPAQLIKYCTNIVHLNKRVTVAGGQQLHIPFQGQLQLSSDCSIPVKAVEGLSKILISHGVLTDLFPHWCFEQVDNDFNVSRRQYINSKEIVVDKFHLSTKNKLNLYPTTAARLKSMIRHIRASDSADKQHQLLAVTDDHPDLCHYTGVAVSNDDTFLHRLFLHSRSSPSFWRTKTISNLPKTRPNNRTCVCSICARSSAHFKLGGTTKQTSHIATHFLHTLVVDWIPAIRPPGSIFGAANLLVAVDKYSHHVWILPAKSRSDVRRFLLYILQDAKRMLPNIDKCHLKLNNKGELFIPNFKVDNDSSFKKIIDDPMKTWLQNHLGVLNFDFTPSGSHARLGLAERFVQRIKIALRAGLWDSPLKLRYWDRLAILISQLFFIMPTSANHKNKSPRHMLYGSPTCFKTQILPYFAPFGAIGEYALAPDQSRRVAYSIWTEHGGTCYYLHKSLSTDGAVAVLIGDTVVDIDCSCTFFDVNPTHRFRSPLEHITMRQGQDFLLPDPRIPATTLPVIAANKINDSFITLTKVPSKEQHLLPKKPLQQPFTAKKPAVINNFKPLLPVYTKQGDLAPLAPTKPLIMTKNIPVITLPKTVFAALSQGKSPLRAPPSPRKVRRGPRVTFEHLTSLPSAAASKLGTPGSVSTSTTSTPVATNSLPTSTTVDTNEQVFKHLLNKEIDISKRRNTHNLRPRKRKRSSTSSTSEPSVASKFARQYLGRFGAKIYNDKIFFFVIDKIESEGPFFYHAFYPIESDPDTDTELMDGDELRACLIFYDKVKALNKVPPEVTKALETIKQLAMHDDIIEQIHLTLQNDQSITHDLIYNTSRYLNLPDVRHSSHDYTEEEVIQCATELLEAHAAIIDPSKRDKIGYTPKGTKDARKVTNYATIWGPSPGGGLRRESDAWWKKDAVDLVHHSKVPRDAKVHYSFTIYKWKKHNPPGRQAKCRVVAGGNNHGQPPEACHSAAVKNSSVLLMLSVIIWYRISTIFSTDMDTAYMQVRTKPGEEKYLIPPEDFTDADGHPIPKGFLLKTKVAVYGFFDSAKLLYAALSKVLTDDGFHCNRHEHGLFTKLIPEENRWMICLIYVDDNLCACSSTDDAKYILKLFREAGYTLTGKLYPSRYLGYNLKYYWTRSKHLAMALDCNDYAQSMVETYKDRINPKKKYNLPSDTTSSDLKFEIKHKDLTDDFSETAIKEARKIVGAALYLCGKDRPTLSSSINLLARFQTKPSPDWQALADHVIGWIQQDLKRDPCLMFYPREDGQPLNPFITALTDAGWKHTFNGRALIGHLTFIGYGDNWSLVSWLCALTKVANLSTTDSETYAMSATTCSLLGLLNILSNEGLKFTSFIGEDNRACLLNTITGKVLGYLGYRENHTHDVLRAGLIRAILKVHTDCNLSDLQSKRTKKPNTFKWMNGMITVSRDAAFHERFTEIDADMYDRSVDL